MKSVLKSPKLILATGAGATGESSPPFEAEIVVALHPLWFGASSMVVALGYGMVIATVAAFSAMVHNFGRKGTTMKFGQQESC